MSLKNTEVLSHLSIKTLVSFIYLSIFNLLFSPCILEVSADVIWSYRAFWIEAGRGLQHRHLQNQSHLDEGIFRESIQSPRIRGLQSSPAQGSRHRHLGRPTTWLVFGILEELKFKQGPKKPREIEGSCCSNFSFKFSRYINLFCAI